MRVGPHQTSVPEVVLGDFFQVSENDRNQPLQHLNRGACASRRTPQVSPTPQFTRRLKLSDTLPTPAGGLSPTDRFLSVPGRRLVSADPAPYALFVLTRKLASQHKPSCNARIVVAGASEAGLACLEHLLQVQLSVRGRLSRGLFKLPTYLRISHGMTCTRKQVGVYTAGGLNSFRNPLASAQIRTPT
eukprot:883430-Prorocentrum_minimum.AAC.3